MCEARLRKNVVMTTFIVALEKKNVTGLKLRLHFAHWLFKGDDALTTKNMVTERA